MNKELKHLIPVNTQGDYHGYHQWYGYDDKIILRCKYKNDIPMGYQEWHLRQKTIYNIR